MKVILPKDLEILLTGLEDEMGPSGLLDDVKTIVRECPKHECMSLKWARNYAHTAYNEYVAKNIYDMINIYEKVDINENSEEFRSGMRPAIDPNPDVTYKEYHDILKENRVLKQQLRETELKLLACEAMKYDRNKDEDISRLKELLWMRIEETRRTKEQYNKLKSEYDILLAEVNTLRGKEMIKDCKDEMTLEEKEYLLNKKEGNNEHIQ